LTNSPTLSKGWHVLATLFGGKAFFGFGRLEVYVVEHNIFETLSNQVAGKLGV
jgi:hypothetical protein